MRSLSLEFAKLRRKRVPLVVAALVGATLVWLLIDAHQEGRVSTLGWCSMLFAAPIMNSLFLSLLATVAASRVVDVDHEANAWKQLLCLQTTRSLLAAKLGCVVLVLAFSVGLELAGIIAIGQMMSFPGMPVLGDWTTFFCSQLAASLCVATIVGAVALRWESQYVAVTCGLALSLAGIFSSFLPEVLQRLVPSGYFTLLSTLRVDWVGGSSEPVFHTVAQPWGDYALLVAFVTAACVCAGVSFLRKEC